MIWCARDGFVVRPTANIARHEAVLHADALATEP
jgi:hypothetical protein